MRAIWKGSISFGLVTIPISLYPATRREELKFRLLRSKDLSPVNYKRVAEADGKEVPWDQIVKGYEYEKGRFVVLKDEDFKRVDVEATQTVDIRSFVKLDDINPLLFHKPYYMEPGKGGDKAYVLLRETLVDTGKVAIAKVVIKTREHLAAVKPQERGLMLELMHFPDEILALDEFKLPKAASPSAAEKKMAKQLVDSMTEKWDPERYKDDYREALEKIIEQKIESGGKLPAAPKAKKHSNIIDLSEVLKRSLAEATKGGAKGGAKAARSAKAAESRKKPAPKAHRRKAA